MIAEILKTQRKKRGLTQQEAADIFHVTRQTISNWENEKNYPDIPTLVAISDYYEVSLDYLMKGDAKYMTKMRKEAKLLDSLRIGLFSIIGAGSMFLFSMIGLAAVLNGGGLENIIPVQLWIMIVTIWLCVIHFKNLQDDMTSFVKNSVSIFLLITIFANLFCLVLYILAAAQIVHF